MNILAAAGLSFLIAFWSVFGMGLLMIMSKEKRDALLMAVLGLFMLVGYFFVIVLFNPGVCHVLQ